MTTVTSQPCSWDFNRYQCAYNDLKAFGHPNPQVWVTEWGWETNDPPPAFHFFGAVSEAQQAAYTVEGIRKMRDSGIVERAYAFMFKTGDAWAYNWLDPAGSPRDVIAAVRALK